MIKTIIAALGSSRAVQVILIAIAVMALIFLLVRRADRAQDAAVEQARDVGAVQQRADDLQATINRVREAQDAREEIRSGAGSARYDECVRSAGATAENCKRFLPR